MLKKPELITAIQNDRERRGAIGKTLKDIKSFLLGDIEDRFNAVTARINQLHDEKHEIIKQPITKAELLEEALGAFRSAKSKAINGFLRTHLEGVQLRNAVPFDDRSINLHFSNETNMWQVFMLAVSEKDIRACVEAIDTQGVPAKQRDEHIKEIDAEVDRLEQLLKGDPKDISVENLRLEQ